MDGTDDNSLKSWVKRELVSNVSTTEKILTEFKEKIPELLSIKDDGKIMMIRTELPAKIRICLYLIGAAYARIAELRESDVVSNKEIIDELQIKKGTVDPSLKELRENGLIVQQESGLHRINYVKIKDVIREVGTSKS